MLQVSANAGIVTMTQEHLNLLVALELPFFIVVTKVDVTSRQKFQDTIDALKKVLASVGMHKVTEKVFFFLSSFSKNCALNKNGCAIKWSFSDLWNFKSNVYYVLVITAQWYIFNNNKIISKDRAFLIDNLQFSKCKIVFVRFYQNFQLRFLGGAGHLKCRRHHHRREQHSTREHRSNILRISCYRKRWKNNSSHFFVNKKN